MTRQDVQGGPPGGWEASQCVSREQALRGYIRYTRYIRYIRYIREQALRGYTVDAAFAAFQEKSLGRIAEGYLADFVALDRDILDATRVPDEQIWQAAGDGRTSVELMAARTLTMY